MARLIDNDLSRFINSRQNDSGLLVETDEDEPTLEAARFGAEIAAMVGTPPARATLELVNACRRGSAFAMTSGSAGPELGATYYALRLFDLAERDITEHSRVAQWIAGQLFVDVSVGRDLDELFYGIRALELIKSVLTDMQRDAVRRFLNDCACNDGGYALMPGQTPDIERTYCALAIWHWLGGRDDREIAQLQAPWVRNCYDNGHIRIHPADSTWSLATCYWGIRCVELLQLNWPWDQCQCAAVECRRVDGGFSASGTSTLWETYCALRVIDIARTKGLFE